MFDWLRRLLWHPESAVVLEVASPSLSWYTLWPRGRNWDVGSVQWRGARLRRVPNVTASIPSNPPPKRPMYNYGPGELTDEVRRIVAMGRNDPLSLAELDNAVARATWNGPLPLELAEKVKGVTQAWSPTSHAWRTLRAQRN